MTDCNPEFKNNIMKLAGESFDEGAKAAIESLVVALEKLIELQPNISGTEVLAAIKIWKEKKYI